MGIILIEKDTNKSIECETFRVTCAFLHNDLPCYFLQGYAYSGDSILIESLVCETDVKEIRKLCDKCEQYKAEIQVQREEKRKKSLLALNEMPEEGLEPEQ